MPYNGQGIFQRIYSWQDDAANDLNVDSERMDRDTDDIADGLTNCITRDGQSPALANIPMGTFKLTFMGPGSASTDSVNYGQVFNSPRFNSPSAAANPSLTGDPLQLATVGAVLNAAFNDQLPAQPGGPLPYTIISVNGTANWQLKPIPYLDDDALAQAYAIALATP